MDGGAARLVNRSRCALHFQTLPPQTEQRRRFRPLVILATVAVVLVVLVTAGGVTAWRLTWLEPAWWPADVAANEQTEALADRVEYRLAEEAHKVRPDDAPWRLRVREDQVNAWLTTRLPEWLAHSESVDWPSSLGTPRVRFADGRVSIGLEFDDHGRPRYLVADLAPQILDGRLSLTLNGVSLGRLWVPGASVQSLIERYRDVVPEGFIDDPAVRRILDMLGNEQRFEPSFDLTDGRKVRLVDVVSGDGELIIECETRVPRPSER